MKKLGLIDAPVSSPEAMIKHVHDEFMIGHNDLTKGYGVERGKQGSMKNMNVLLGGLQGTIYSVSQEKGILADSQPQVCTPETFSLKRKKIYKVILLLVILTVIQ